jgi:hypothetical protein
MVARRAAEHRESPSFYRDLSGGAPKYPTQSNPMAHAFIVVGSETIFLCHQIMSHMEGHNYEMVLEARLPLDTVDTLIRDRDEGRTHYLANDKEWHRLASMKAGHVTRFEANIWNSFEKAPKLMPPWGIPGQPRPPWLTDVPVEIVRVVHYRHSNANLTGRRHEEYFLFGKGNEAHLYHSIVRQPDYDHVATLKARPEWLSTPQLEAGVSVSFPGLPWAPEETRCMNPLADGSRHEVRYFGITEYRNSKTGEDPKPVPRYKIHVGRTWWFSTRVVNYFDRNPCPPPPDHEIS